MKSKDYNHYNNLIRAREKLIYTFWYAFSYNLDTQIDWQKKLSQKS